MPIKLLPELQTRYDRLCENLRDGLQGGILIAFSGGVDSAFLLWVAEHQRRQHGGKLLAITTVSPSLASSEREDAAQFVKMLGVDHRWEQSQEFSNPDYLRNDLKRCYYCKTELFRISHAIASELGYRFIAYGYNASDGADFRPGHQAAREQGILAPLSDARLTKEDIRTLMRELGITLADKPASPCLSSRLMTGVAVTPEKLRDIEEVEQLLRSRGLNVFRARLHEFSGEKWLRIEVASQEMVHALEVREDLVASARRRGFSWVTLDLAGYRIGGGNSSSTAKSL